MSVPQLLYTKNHKGFVLNAGSANRSIKEYHVARLCKLMEKSGFIPSFPIICDRNFMVIDGQHRLKAAERLNIGVWYTIEEKVSPRNLIDINNSQLHWNKRDRMDHHVVMRTPEYLKLENFSKRLGYDYNIVLTFLNNDPLHLPKGFKEGTFVFPSDKEIELENYIRFIMSYFEIIRSQYKGRKVLGRKLIFTLRKFLDRKDVDPDWLRERLEKDFCQFEVYNSIDGYLQMFVNLYNYRRSKKDKLTQAI